MSSRELAASRLLDSIVEILDIPQSYYEKARRRYESLGEWLHRDESTIARFDPAVYPQGSFRYGTVIRPLMKKEEYDLDLVSQVALTKDSVTQAQLKELVGCEIKAYATAKGVKAPVEEKKRCWRLDYADEVAFHMDILPAIPNDESVRRTLVSAGAQAEFTRFVLAITDTRHAHFDEICSDWLSSNPKGFAKWFESRMRFVAERRLRELVQARIYASVDDVPPYTWKTPLQQSIQILKRHRDVMFKANPEVKPISMIITTLSAEAYDGETSLFDAITNILDGMLDHVNDGFPRVRNPVNRAEDFADQWSKDSRLEKNFRAWHGQARADIDQISRATDKDILDRHLRTGFDAIVEDDLLRELVNSSTGEAARVITAAPAVIRTAPRPWGPSA
ncbi:MAG: nucleotidyltransferase [Planctomycetes bacterium]|nr:nucleotidyltransferase [Planctomycetota bacterium]